MGRAANAATATANHPGLWGNAAGTFIDIATGQFGTAAIRSDGTLWMTGVASSNSVLGDSGTLAGVVTTPVQVPPAARNYTSVTYATG